MYIHISDIYIYIYTYMSTYICLYVYVSLLACLTRASREARVDGSCRGLGCSGMWGWLSIAAWLSAGLR